MFSDFQLSLKEPPVLATVDTSIMAKGEEFVFDGNADIGAKDQDINCSAGRKMWTLQHYLSVQRQRYRRFLR
jgi:hypothetical protein